jgi:hypothetical protein
MLVLFESKQERRAGSDKDHWPDEHVAWQGVIAASPDTSVPFAVHVFIFHTIDQLQAASRSPEANGHSRVYDEVDGAGVGAVLMLVKDALEISILAHEATHMALFWHQRQDYVGRVGARRWLLYHPEHVAEMVGNLTALLWYGIPEASELP